MKISLNTILLASLLAFSSPMVTAREYRSTRGVSAPALRTTRFLSEDETTSGEEETSSLEGFLSEDEAASGEEETSSLEGGGTGPSSDEGGLEQRSFMGAPTERECEMCK
jgi:hypothetical protein